MASYERHTGPGLFGAEARPNDVAPLGRPNGVSLTRLEEMNAGVAGLAGLCFCCVYIVNRTRIDGGGG